jgi:hypothetical protein
MTPRLSSALLHLESAQRELDRGNASLAVLDLGRAVRVIVEVMVWISSGQHRCGNGRSVCSPEENVIEARRVIEQLRGGT